MNKYLITFFVFLIVIFSLLTGCLQGDEQDETDDGYYDYSYKI